MRGGDRERATRRERFENRAAQRRAFDWIGAGAQLVDENERVLGSGAQHLGEVLEMRAECREAGQDGLLVSDISVDIVEDRDPRSHINRRRNPGLHQRGEEPERLEQHRLAASVRAGDEKRPLVRQHLEIEGNDVDSLGNEERVAALDYGEALCWIGQLRRSAAELDRVTRARDEGIERDQRFERCSKRLAVRAKLLRQLRKNPVNLFDFLDLQLTNAIPCLDRRRRLDEQCSARCRCVVHDSTNHALRFAPNRNHEAPVPHRHGHVGDPLMRLELGHGALEKLDQLPLGTLQLAPDFLERRRRVIANLAVLVDRALDRVLDVLVGDEGFDLRGENSRDNRRRPFTAQGVARDARAAKQRAEHKEIRWGERGAFHAQTQERRARVGDAVQMPRLFGRYERAHGGHTRVLSFDDVPVGCRAQLSHPLAAEWRRRSLGNEGERARKLNDVERVRIHAKTS